MHIVYRLALVLASATAFTATASAQFEIGGYYGHAYYMGDLERDSEYSPLPVGNGHRAFGGYARYFVNDRIALNGSAMATTIEGSDDKRAGSRTRNLSFFSRLYEVGISGEYYPFGAERSIAPYVTLGGAFYRFNPKTRFNGRTVELQPLGTEGQGAAGYGPRYSLNRFAVPLGAGTRIAFGRSWVIGVEAKLRMTFFDHLDDVSGGYVNYYELVQSNGSLAAELANRTHQLTGTEPLDLPTGTQRGNPANFDYYMSVGLTVGYRLGSGAFGAGGGRDASRYNKCYQF